MAVVAKSVNEPGCGPGIRGFESRRSPHVKYQPSTTEGFSLPKTSQVPHRDQRYYLK